MLMTEVVKVLGPTDQAATEPPRFVEVIELGLRACNAGGHGGNGDANQLRVCGSQVFRARHRHVHEMTIAPPLFPLFPRTRGPVCSCPSAQRGCSTRSRDPLQMGERHREVDRAIQEVAMEPQPAQTSPRKKSTEMTRWDPFMEIERMHTELSRFLQGITDAPIAAADGFVPLADLEETDDEYLIEIELPGVKRNDIDVAISDRRARVTGTRKEKERKGILRRRTRAVGEFAFEIMLPGEVDGDSAEAHIEDGVLYVRIPKTSREHPHRIEVS
jgi:HSP20 family protein